jgi:hypothetical protein
MALRFLTDHCISNSIVQTLQHAGRQKIKPKTHPSIIQPRKDGARGSLKGNLLL